MADRFRAIVYKHCLMLLLVLASALPAWASQDGTNWFKWSELPPLPDKLGVAGAFVGRSNEVLIVAGGCQTAASAGGGPRTIYRDVIYVLRLTGDRQYRWETGGRLPGPVAYGASVASGQSVICLGGREAKGNVATVLRLRWDAQRRCVQIDRSLPSLPRACYGLAAASLGKTIYVAGGTHDRAPTKDFWTLELEDAGEVSVRRSWTAEPAWPGEPPVRSSPCCPEQRGTQLSLSAGWQGKEGLPH